jgi:hypothetical protein
MEDIIPSFFSRNVKKALADHNAATPEAVARLDAEIKHEETIEGVGSFLIAVVGMLRYVDAIAKCIVAGHDSHLFAPASQPSVNPPWKELDREDIWEEWAGLVHFNLPSTDRRENAPAHKGEFRNVLLTDICRFLHKMKVEGVMLIDLPIPLEGIKNEIILACNKLKSYRIGLIEEPAAWLSCWRLAETLADQLPQNFGLGYYLCEVFRSKLDPEIQRRQSIALSSEVRFNPLCQWLFGLLGKWDRGNVEARLQKEAVLLADRLEKAKAKISSGSNKDSDCTNLKGKPAKRSTERGEGRAKLTAALTKHHKYADGSCLNLEPIGNNELARQADVWPSTASAFFNYKFKSHQQYRAICRDAGKLADALKVLNDDFSPYELYGRRPADEEDRDEDE